MSPATLYREGLELDALLDELDAEYPGRVRVLTIAHPREGGVLGFFAKQRVGVHYRLLGEEAGGSAASQVPASQLPARHTAYDGVIRDGIIYDGAIRDGAIRDGVIRDGASATGGAATSRAAAGEHSGANEGGPADSGVQFAQILAELALRKAGQTPGRAPQAAHKPARQPARATATTAAPASAARPTSAAATTSRAAAATATSAPATAPRPATPTSDPATAADPVAAPAPVAKPVPTAAKGPMPAPITAADFEPLAPESVSTTGASAPTITAAPGAVPAVAPGTVAAVALGTVPATRAVRSAFDTLPKVTTSGAILTTPWTPDVDDTSESQNAVMAGSRVATRPASDGTTTGGTSANGTAALRAPRESRLNWPLAQQGAAPSAPRSPAHIPSQIPSAQTMAPSVPQAAAQANHADTTASSNRLALRRQLIEMGVPIDRVPADAPHAYAAVETLVSLLPQTPTPPIEAGEILVLAGPARDAIIAAETLITESGRAFADVRCYGCPTESAAGRTLSSEPALHSVADAQAAANNMRDSASGPALIVVGTDAPAWTESPIDAVAAIAPIALWAVVDATRKPADTRRSLAALGSPDSIVVANAATSSSPATVWGLDLPIALLDGRPSTSSAWAVLLLNTLAEMERPCSDARC